MEAKEYQIGVLLQQPCIFHIPLFQRNYAWTKQQWETLLKDVMNLIENGDAGHHFIGSLVLFDHGKVEDESSGTQELDYYLVIDGQQRLMTLSIALSALRDVATEVASNLNDEEDGMHGKKLRSLAGNIDALYLAQNGEVDSPAYYRIKPRSRDYDGYRDVLSGAKDKAESGITKSYNWFKRQFRKLANEGEDGPTTIQNLGKAFISKLMAVRIVLSQENPFQIFETLNNKGLRLREADLIRNLVFMSMPIRKKEDRIAQETFDDEHWKGFEAIFESREPDDKNDEIDMDSFYRDYLMLDGSYVKFRGAYVAFAKHFDPDKQDHIELAKQLKHYASLYQWIRRPDIAVKEAGLLLGRELDYLKWLAMYTYDPFVLSLLDRLKKRGLDESSIAETCACFRALQSFIIRRAICNEETRNYYRMLPSASAEVTDGNELESLIKYLDGKGWPRDDRFKAELGRFQVYRKERNITRLLLIGLEHAANKHREAVDVANMLRTPFGKDEYGKPRKPDAQIEHILPQTLTDNRHGKAWKAMLGDGWEELHGEWVHTLGNLTVTAYNASLSNKSFEDKLKGKDDDSGLLGSKIKLNEHFRHLGTWDAAAIEARGTQLVERVSQLWPEPDAGLLRAAVALTKPTA